MSKKIITLLKMIILSVGLIALFTIINNKEYGDVPDMATGTTNHYFAMGTSVTINLYDKDNEIDEAGLGNDIIEEIKALDQDILSWRSSDSELGRFNNSNSTNTQISTELYTVLAQSLAICKDSGGALDITIRPLVALWNIEGDGGAEFVPPQKEEIENVLDNVDYQNINLISENKEKYYIYRNSRDTVIDLGATGKGYALDVTREILEKTEVDGAIITVGGSILIYGDKGDGSSWKIGVRNPLEPDDTNAMMGYLEFEAGTTACISTSGGYEKFKTYEGKEYHHILDSKSGYPADSGVLSVTVVCDNGLVSDGLSTACYVLGYEKSLPILEKYNAQAIFMDSNGDIIVTDGLKNCWVKQ